MAAFARIGFCLLMSKTFRPWTIDQPLLLPPSVQDFVGEDHLARFILALVLEHLDLGEIEAGYASERGQPPFDPAMMTALLLYGYCNGVYSSRRIAKASRERVDFMSVVGLDPPDFRTVSDFRKRHLKALARVSRFDLAKVEILEHKRQNEASQVVLADKIPHARRQQSG